MAPQIPPKTYQILSQIPKIWFKIRDVFSIQNQTPKQLPINLPNNPKNVPNMPPKLSKRSKDGMNKYRPQQGPVKGLMGLIT